MEKGKASGKICYFTNLSCLVQRSCGSLLIRTVVLKIAVPSNFEFDLREPRFKLSQGFRECNQVTSINITCVLWNILMIGSGLNDDQEVDPEYYYTYS